MSQRTRVPTARATARIPVEDIRPVPTRGGRASFDYEKITGAGAGNLILWFVVIGLIAWCLLYALKPTVVQKVGLDGLPTGDADTGKTLLGALLIALIITLIIWLLRSCR